jgi:hypothetical protein
MNSEQSDQTPAAVTNIEVNPSDAQEPTKQKNRKMTDENEAGGGFRYQRFGRRRGDTSQFTEQQVGYKLSNRASFYLKNFLSCQV